jgi:hypothetical protein
MKDQLYVLGDPAEHAAGIKERMLALQVSEPYAEAARIEIEARCVHVDSLHESAMIASGRSA